MKRMINLHYKNGALPRHRDFYQDEDAMLTCSMLSLFPVEMLIYPHQEPGRNWAIIFM